MYTIICTQFTQGNVTKIVEKDDVKNECERLRKVFCNPKFTDTKNLYIRIEVVNNDTGEIREYYNNKENIINF